jgi:hypothetical protein
VQLFCIWPEQNLFYCIHETMKVSSGGELRMQPRGPQEIQRDFRLW